VSFSGLEQLMVDIEGDTGLTSAQLDLPGHTRTEGRPLSDGGIPAGSCADG